jgi:hypothetical protein
MRMSALEPMPGKKAKRVKEEQAEACESFEPPP